MSEKQSSVKINETHLGYIQAVINRMGQNSFQAKTWCITVISLNESFSGTKKFIAVSLPTIIQRLPKMASLK